MEKAKADFYTSDGRINPDKAFAFVSQRVRTMSSEEFCTLMGKALEGQEEGETPTPTRKTVAKSPRAGAKKAVTTSSLSRVSSKPGRKKVDR